MRFWKFLLIFLFVSLPTLTRGEVVFLKDGSQIKGTLVRFAEDMAYFKTSFGAEIRIPREKILRIEFSDSLASPAVISPGRPQSIRSTPSVPGTLLVEFDNVTVSSTISVHRDKDRKGHERANTIEAVLIVDGKAVYVAADSTTDKVIKKGAEVLVRNSMTPEGMRVGLSPGLHQVTVILANRRAGKYKDRLENGGLNKRVSADNVLILEGETRLVTIGLRRKTLGLRGRELYVVP